MARVLVVEDEDDIRAVLEFNLRRAGHAVDAVSAGKEALALARTHPYDVMLLDLMLPDMPGTDICRAIKLDSRTCNMHVIMVTAKGEEIDRVVGLELGADDYVVKPFSVRELVLRVGAVLRRSGPEPSGRTVEFGVLRLDREAHRVWVEGVEVELTSLERKLLTTLYDRRNRVQSRETLLADVWDIRADITTRTVDTHVKRLREKLGRAGGYVQTVRGTGYRFAETADETL